MLRTSTCTAKDSDRYGWCLLHLLLITLLQMSKAVGPTAVVEKGFPISESQYVNVWAPKIGSTRTDTIWFMSKQPGTNITMVANIKNGCKKCPLTGKTPYFVIGQQNRWFDLKVMFTTRYGASTVKIDGNYFYPRRQDKENPPLTITISSTSDIYWTKLNPNEEPFFQQGRVGCPSARSESGVQHSGSGVQEKYTSEDGFELDLITLVSLGANALLLLMLLVTVCYYKQKVRAEVRLRKSKEESQKVTYRQSMDPASYITYNQEQSQHQGNIQDKGYENIDGNQTLGVKDYTLDIQHYQGEDNQNFQE